jgi:hypothetical protein
MFLTFGTYAEIVLTTCCLNYNDFYDFMIITAIRVKKEIQFSF